MSSRGAVLAAAVLCLAGYSWIYSTGVAWPPIRSDGFSYYVYVPSWFLFHDTTLSAVARDCCGGAFPEYTAIIRWPGTRHWVNAHPMGAAVMQAPLFPVAHALTRWTNLTPDGFSLYYQHACGLAGLAWIVAGLVMLRRLLKQFFRDTVVAWTLLVLLFGTNLYHYATYDSSYSHPYSFFLFAAFLYLTLRWHDGPTTRVSALIGIVAGFIVLTRHTNALFLMTFPLFGVTSLGAARTMTVRLLHHWRQLAVITGVGSVVVLPQLLIYYDATGRFLVSSYGSLGFHWSEPKLLGVLFGVQKGLFFWSPLLALAVAGLVVLWRSSSAARAFVPGGLLFLAVNTYIIASWFDWQFGGSYGHRGYVDVLPFFALGLAALLQWSVEKRRRVLLVTPIIACLCALSVFQMLQYWYGIIPISDTTWEQYTELFLRWR